METKINSYYGMAYNDYCFAKAGMQVGEQLGNYNGVAALCAQSAEKYLKAVLEITFSEEALALLHSHNLRAITNKLKEFYPDLPLSTKDINWLSSLYFDAKAPGDNFVEVNKDDALECLRLTEDLAQKVTVLLEQNDQKMKKKKDSLKQLDTFDI